MIENRKSRVLISNIKIIRFSMIGRKDIKKTQEMSKVKKISVNRENFASQRSTESKRKKSSQNDQADQINFPKDNLDLRPHSILWEN